MEPLDRKRSFQTITDFISRAKEVIIVAPYFGGGAFKQLGFDTYKASGTIICDLYSGACNPEEIKEFMKPSLGLSVRTLDNLHAKIYWTDKGIVVGSANPSANGLAFEGKETGGLLETCVASEDISAVTAWKSYIKANFLSPSRVVTPNDIKAAIPIWKPQRDTRPKPPSSDGLLALMQKQPEVFKDRNIVITAYDSADPSATSKKKFQSQKKQRKIIDLDFYENWVLGPGTTIVDFNYVTPKSRPQFGGFYQALHETPVVPTTRDSSILLVVKLRDLLGMKLPQDEKVKLAEIVRRLMPGDPKGTDHEMNFYEFVCKAHEQQLL
jgi:hypothetical protein